MKRFALAGNPNCGKTTLFNNLTGSTAHVGNWPGVTVDKRSGTYKKLKEQIEIVDLPGIYSLSPYTPEEVIARNFILEERPDCIVNIVDATNLERNLYLTTQILEIDVPVVIALNMMDEVEKQGNKIDEKALEERLGVPVCKISALKESGLEELMERAYEAAEKPREGKTVLASSALAHLIGDVKIALKGQGVKDPLFHAVKLVENDSLESEVHKDTLPMIEEFKSTFEDDVFGSDFEALVADARYKYISKYFAPTLTKKQAEFGMTKSDKIDRVLTHRVWGIPIFLVILFLVFHLTFSEDLLFLGKAGVFDNNAVIETPEEEAEVPEGAAVEEESAGAIAEFLSEVNVHTFFGFEESVFSPGIVLFNAMETLTGLLSACMTEAMASAPAWASGLVVDGILGGLFSVLSFLPQILLLFLFFSLLEDSGYMARVAFILDRIFRRFGLSGRAFMPMIMGFGCSIPAMTNTRTLADDKERTATVRVIPFFSCSAKLPILTAIAGGIVESFGVGNADLITYLMYLLGVVVAIVSVILMRATTMKGEVPPFIMELPAYHLPQFKALMIHLFDKAKHFIKKAFTIILASTIVIWFVSHFSWNWHYLEDEQMNLSILAGLGGLLQPLFTPLGFGSQLGEFGWVFVVAAVTGLIAKENVIATFGTLAACISAGFAADEALGGVDSVVQMIHATGVTVPALIAFIAFNMTTIPCFAAVATARAELPGEKSFKMTLLFWAATSFVVGTLVYLIGSWWWTAFIFAALAAGAIAAIVIKNKGGIKAIK